MGVSLLSDYKQMASNLQTSLKQVGKQPDIARDIEYYRSHITKVKSIDDFMKDTRLYTFAMKAFGMKDMIYAKAFIRKALTEGIDKSGAFSLKLSDPRYRDFVETFNFARYGSATTAFDRTQQGTIDRFLRTTLEEQAGQTSEGLRLALYFQRKASSIDSTYGILADQAIYTVVRTGLGLPAALSSTDIDKQAQLIGSKLNLKDFDDPAKVDKFITRFLAQYQMTSAPSQAASPAMSLISGTMPGVDMATLQSLQTLRRYGA